MRMLGGWDIRLTNCVIVDDGTALQDALQEMTSQRSVPNIFIGKQHIGGNSDLQALDKDTLKQKLTAAHAL